MKDQVRLISVYLVPQSIGILYDLLSERTPDQSISHKSMPTMAEHKRFIDSKPYYLWYLIQNRRGEFVGSIYLTHQREVGIFIFERFARRGYGKKAVQELMTYWPGRMLANINPKNESSIKFFQSLGAKHIQNTYEL